MSCDESGCLTEEKGSFALQEAAVQFYGSPVMQYGTLQLRIVSMFCALHYSLSFPPERAMAPSAAASLSLRTRSSSSLLCGIPPAFRSR